MKEIPRRPNNLIGKGGVGLVMFYLARQGIEFVLTSDRSDQGDIWIDGAERVLKGEIKTSTKDIWPVRIDQTHRVDVFFFVHLLRGECWILSSDSVRIAIRSETRSSATVGLTIKQIKSYPEGDMSALALHPHGNLYRPKRLAKATPPDPTSEPIRTVTRTLANGETKEYRYPRSHHPSSNDPLPFSISFPHPRKTDRF